MRKNYTLNLFRLTNLSEINFSYKLIPTNLSAENRIEINNKMIQKAAQIVSSQNSVPVATYISSGKYYLAVPSNTVLKSTQIQTTPLIVQLNCSEAIDYSSSKFENINSDIILRFLEFKISQHLTENQNLWRGNLNQFFTKIPLNYDSIKLDIYPGFIYKLIRHQDGHFYIALDLTYKYVDKLSIPSYLKNEYSRRALRGSHCLYQNGDNWYSIIIEDFGNKINDDEFIKDGKTYKVYDYITQKNRGAKFNLSNILKNDDTTILYKYTGRSMEPHKGAASLARRLFSTNDDIVKSIHNVSILAPTKRFEYIEKSIAKHFNGINFNGIRLVVDEKPKKDQSLHFFLPALKYNNNQVLNINNSSEIYDFPANRKRMLKNGILDNSIFQPQYLLVPDYLEKEKINAFKTDIEQEIKRLAPYFDHFELIRYPINLNIPVSNQINKIEEVLMKKDALSGYALFLLPDDKLERLREIKNFHDIIKNRFYDTLKFQCISTEKIFNYYQSFPSTRSLQLLEYKVAEDKIGKFKSILFNLVLEYLNINRKWAYALKEALNYDVYIGIDIHQRFAGFSFFYKNGEKIFIDTKRVPLKNKSVRVEKIKAVDIIEVVYNKLKSHIPKYCNNPNGIIFIRDGKSFEEEEKAMQEIIERLANENLITKNTLNWGIIELHKQSSIPIRMVIESNNYDKYQNVIAGSYTFISKNEAFIFNTGYPFKIKGTTKPLYLIHRNGNINFEKALQDIFNQSMLAFSAPDKSNSLPITIKLIDSFLQPLVINEEEFNESFEEEYEEQSYGTN